MQKTLFTLLTNKQARTAGAVEAILDQEFTVGAPWFWKLHTEFIEQTQ